MDVGLGERAARCTRPAPRAAHISWCGKTRSLPPPCTSKRSPRWSSAIARALDVPAGRPGPNGRSQAGSPGRSARHSRQSSGSFLPGAVGVAAALGEDRAASPRGPARTPSPKRRVGGDGEVEVVRRRGRRAPASSSRSISVDRPAGSTRPRRRSASGGEHPQRRPCPGGTARSRARRARPSRRRPCVGALQQRVVDVGDVLDVAHLVAGVAPGPVEQVEGDVGRGVAQVGGVVRRDAADVQPGRARRASVATSAPDRRCRGPATGGPGRRGSAGTSGAAARLRMSAKPSRAAAAQNGGHGIARPLPARASGRVPRREQPLGTAAPSAVHLDAGAAGRASRVAQPAVERRRAAARRAATSSSVSGSPEPAPQHGAQLVLDVEGDAVVDAVAVAVGHRAARARPCGRRC